MRTQVKNLSLNLWYLHILCTFFIRAIQALAQTQEFVMITHLTSRLGSKVVMPWTANPQCAGSIPALASNILSILCSHEIS